MTDVEARVARLLDQLERTDLTENEVDQIKKKIALLREQQS